MTAQPLFDGTFSTDSVASAGHTLVARLHDEAMATIAELAENWDRPAPEPAPAQDDSVVYREPATWSVQDDEDQHDEYGDDEDEDETGDDVVRVVPRLELPALLPQPRPAGNVALLLATAATDEFAVPEQDDRHSLAS